MSPSVPTIPRRPLKAAYDFVVLGAGSGGCAVTRRLVDAGYDTLLIEAGPAGFGDPAIEDPSRWVSLFGSAYDWGYAYAPSPEADGRVIAIPRGKVLGGSSATNAMMWYRGHPADYDAWEAAGARGWSFADCLPYFRRCEDWQGGADEWRGAGGPLRIETPARLHPVAQALIDGAAECGVPVIADPNGEGNEGAAPANFNIRGDRRWSAADGYLVPVLERPNLTVLTGSVVTGLDIGNGRAIAVRHLVDGREVTTGINERIVLALGAIDTPRLLMLSGIGDPSELSALSIRAKAALPGVGRNFQDHPLAQACVFRARRPLGPMVGNGGGSMVNWKSRPDMAQADIHAFPVQGNSAEPAVREAYDLAGDMFAFGAGVMRSDSVGHVRLLEAKVGGAIEIQPNFLATAADREAMLTAIDDAMAFGAAKANRHLVDGFAAPDRRLGRAELLAFARRACSTFFHCCGTARMGEDDGAVVDSRLSLRGIEKITIADASVIPVIPSCNTHAPATMIGERAADFILGRSLAAGHAKEFAQ